MLRGTTAMRLKRWSCLAAMLVALPFRSDPRQLFCLVWGSWSLLVTSASLLVASLLLVVMRLLLVAMHFVTTDFLCLTWPFMNTKRPLVGFMGVTLASLQASFAVSRRWLLLAPVGAPKEDHLSNGLEFVISLACRCLCASLCSSHWEAKASPIQCRHPQELCSGPRYEGVPHSVPQNCCQPFRGWHGPVAGPGKPRAKVH